MVVLTRTNPVTAADLNETSLENAVIEIAALDGRAWSSHRRQASQLVIVPPLMFVATRLLYSEGVGTADNDINAIRNNGSIPEGYTVNHYLTDSNAFFLMTDVPNGMKHFQRTAMSTSMDADFDTGNVAIRLVSVIRSACLTHSAFSDRPAH